MSQLGELNQTKLIEATRDRHMDRHAQNPVDDLGRNVRKQVPRTRSGREIKPNKSPDFVYIISETLISETLPRVGKVLVVRPHPVQTRRDERKTNNRSK